MTKKDIVKKIMEALPDEFLSPKEAQLSFDFASPAPRDVKKAETYAQVVVDTIKWTLLLGENVEISGFGKFIIRRKNERVGRNPQTERRSRD